VPSRERARRAIAAGQVTVAGAPADKASRLVHPADAVLVSGDASRFVSRGGLKLDAALDRFAIDVDAKRALDAGVSTGGFTDCLLQRGAAHVVAVDVGYGQLHERLRADERVSVLERTNIRHVRLDDVGGLRVPVVTADLSFISLRTVLPTLVALAATGADLVALVKPQFEAGRVEASRGRGVIRDPAVWRRVLGEVTDALEAEDAVMMGIMVSPLRGADGNVEFLAHARAHARGAGQVDLDAVVRLASEELP
jgi:23S rRNA (cytidine1920-2'-O)/16S rRNA (cytidine1409-2'-O)-methyltransferase